VPLHREHRHRCGGDQPPAPKPTPSSPRPHRRYRPAHRALTRHYRSAAPASAAASTPAPRPGLAPQSGGGAPAPGLARTGIGAGTAAARGLAATGAALGLPFGIQLHELILADTHLRYRGPAVDNRIGHRRGVQADRPHRIVIPGTT